jgi:hypothetical protein
LIFNQNPPVVWEIENWQPSTPVARPDAANLKKSPGKFDRNIVSLSGIAAQKHYNIAAVIELWLRN